VTPCCSANGRAPDIEIGHTIRPNPYDFSIKNCVAFDAGGSLDNARIAFRHNKNTGNRIRYKKVDGDTGEEVSQSDIIKGYQVEKNVYVTIEESMSLLTQSGH
jgi:hypothetical protein